MAFDSALLALQQATARSDTTTQDSVVVESPLPTGAAEVVHFLLNTVPQWVQIAGVFVGAFVAVALLVIGWRHRQRIYAWFAARSGAWKLGTVAVVLLVLGGVGFAGVKSWTFIKHDNSFCSGCHLMAEPFLAFTSSEHSELMCHECHQENLRDKARQLYQWVAERPDRIGPHAVVPNGVCITCHSQRDADSTWQRISATAGHAIHLNPRSPVMRETSCLTCHGQEVHRFTPVQETCAQSGCHDRLLIQLGKMAGQTSLHCSTCHNFASPLAETGRIDSARAALVPNEEQCLACHKMRERLKSFRPDADPHNGVCGACHNPHTQTTPAGAFQSCATSGCHAPSDSLIAKHRPVRGHRLRTCGACHGAHTWTAAGVACESCHTGISDPAVRVPRPPRGSEEVPHPLAQPPIHSR